MIPSHPGRCFLTDFPGFLRKTSSQWLCKSPFPAFSMLHRESWMSFPIPMEPGWVFLFSLWGFFSKPLFPCGIKQGLKSTAEGIKVVFKPSPNTQMWPKYLFSPGVFRDKWLLKIKHV